MTGIVTSERTELRIQVDTSASQVSEVQQVLDQMTQLNQTYLTQAQAQTSQLGKIERALEQKGISLDMLLHPRSTSKTKIKKKPVKPLPTSNNARSKIRKGAGKRVTPTEATRLPPISSNNNNSREE